jgi:uncharacterized protein YukE
MIISRIERDAIHTAYLTIDGLAFPGDLSALCFQLGDALKIVKTPVVQEIEAAAARLEASIGGLRTARQRIQDAADGLRGSWSGEAADIGHAALLRLGDDLDVLARSVRDEIAAEAAQMKTAGEAAAATVDTARLRMIRAFSLTPQLRRYLYGDANPARYATLFSLIKTEAKRGLYAVMGAYADFDQASARFVTAVRRAERAIRPEHPARTGGFLA